MRFRAKIDWWGGFVIVYALICFPFFLNMGYRLDEDGLVINMGWIKPKVIFGR